MLGVLIERVTGQPYATALRTRLLVPLGLHDTGYDTRAVVVERMASGYVRAGSAYAPEAYIDVSLPFAAGMLYYLPEHEWTVIVLDNRNGDVGRVGNDLVRLLLGQSVAMPK